jgi:predicted ATPase/DNA-binding SARP family transcriptional activator
MEFRILGPLEVRDGGREVSLGGDKRRSLLAALLLHANEPVSPERLAQSLWGEDASAEAVKTLRVHVSRVRAALAEPDRVRTVPAGYELRLGEEELDAARFEQLLRQGRRALLDGAPERAAELLHAALALWRGDVLADLRYEAFAQPTIARLEELRWDAIEARNDADLELGRFDAVLERRVDEAPLRERLVEQRMRALYAAGRHVEALAVYRDAQRRLDVELGLRPGPALRELELAVLEHDTSLRPRASLPPPPTATVGRAHDLETVAAAIAGRRLVTLTGPGGVGKTRVAVEAARAYPGGVHVAQLARVATAAEVPGALLRAVATPPQPGEREIDALARRLGGPETLLVVDNVEHVIDASPFLAELVEACPRLHVLATSREPLRLRGEQCVPISPLAVSDAITLFLDRARERRPDFGLTDDNAPAVAELCRRLDGLPLAIELAAGRIGLLEPEQLVQRLADALSLLEGGPRDAPTRQRTIRATLKWSVALLDPDERQAFRRLAVFADGAELDAAQAVTEAPLAVLDALVAKSLATVHQQRIRQLEVVRQFAAAEFDEDAVRRRHAEHYLALAEGLASPVRVTGRGRAFDALERELGNCRAALEHWVGAGDGDRALRLAAALEPYWSATGDYRSGAGLLDAALTLQASQRARGRARLARSILLRGIRMEESVEDADAALELCTAAGDLEGRCLALDMVSAHAAYFGDFERARALSAQERALAGQLGDPYLTAIAVMRQAWSAGDFTAGRAFGQEAIPLLRRCGHLRGIVEVTAGLVGGALFERDYEAAAATAQDGLRAAEEAGEPVAMAFALGNAALPALFLERMDVAEPLFVQQLELVRRERIDSLWCEAATGLACIAAHAGEPERAATLLGFGEAMPAPPAADRDREVRDRLTARYLAPARSALGELAWKRAVAAGAGMTPDEVGAFVLHPRSVRGAT